MAGQLASNLATNFTQVTAVAPGSTICGVTTSAAIDDPTLKSDARGSTRSVVVWLALVVPMALTFISISVVVAIRSDSSEQLPDSQALVASAAQSTVTQDEEQQVVRDAGRSSTPSVPVRVVGLASVAAALGWMSGVAMREGLVT